MHLEKEEPGARRGGGATPGHPCCLPGPISHEMRKCSCSSFQIPQVMQLRWGWGVSGTPSPTGLPFVHLTLALRGSANTDHSPSPSLFLCLLLPLSLLPAPCLGDSSVCLEKSLLPSLSPQGGPDPTVSGRCSGNFPRTLESLVGLKTSAPFFPLPRKGEGLSRVRGECGLCHAATRWQ